MICMKVLVAYYSWKGHTEYLAKEIAGKLDASLVKIEPLTDPGPGMLGKAMKALFVKREQIKPCQTDLEGFDHLVVATPVWSGKIPPYVHEYLSRVSNCEGKKFSVFAEMGGRGADYAIMFVRKLLGAKGMLFVASGYTIEKDVDARVVGPQIEEFLQEIQGEGPPEE
jgi:flavodoxin